MTQCLVILTNLDVAEYSAKVCFCHVWFHFNAQVEVVFGTLELAHQIIANRYIENTGNMGLLNRIALLEVV